MTTTVAWLMKTSKRHRTQMADSVWHEREERYARRELGVGMPYGILVGVAVGTTGTAVGGFGVAVGGALVAVGGTGVAVAGATVGEAIPDAGAGVGVAWKSAACTVGSRRARSSASSCATLSRLGGVTSTTGVGGPPLPEPTTGVCEITRASPGRGVEVASGAPVGSAGVAVTRGVAVAVGVAAART